MEGLPPNEERFFRRLERLWEKIPESLRSFVIFIGWLVIILSVGFSGYSLLKRFDMDIRKYQQSSLSDSTDISTENCNVLGIDLHGFLTTYIPPDSSDSFMAETDMVSSESILYYLNQAEKDKDIKAIVMEVDSSGGLPVAGEEVANAIKASTKPIVALIRQTGASAAYWAISSADRIFASRNSDVGSIGVTISYLENVNKNLQDGYSFIQLSAGKYKDYGNPDKSLTPEERALIIRDLNIVHENFIEAISINRGIPLEDVKKMADGATVLGETARSLHLIDEIGSIIEVKKYLSEQIGEEVELCWY